MAVPMTTTVVILPLMRATSWGRTIRGEDRVTPGVRAMSAASVCGNTPTDWMRPADDVGQHPVIRAHPSHGLVDLRPESTDQSGQQEGHGHDHPGTDDGDQELTVPIRQIRQGHRHHRWRLLHASRQLRLESSARAVGSFVIEEPGLSFEPTPVAGQLTVRPDDPVAGDDDGHRVAPVGQPDRP